MAASASVSQERPSENWYLIKHINYQEQSGFLKKLKEHSSQKVLEKACYGLGGGGRGTRVQCPQGGPED